MIEKDESVRERLKEEPKVNLWGRRNEQTKRIDWSEKKDEKAFYKTTITSLLEKVKAYQLTHTDVLLAESYEDAVRYHRTEIDKKLEIYNEKESIRSLDAISFIGKEGIVTLYCIAYDHYRGTPIRCELHGRRGI